MMSIDDMDREALFLYMRAAPAWNGLGRFEINNFDPESPAWKRAFKLAKLAGMESITMECTKCKRKVKEWLENGIPQ